MGKPGAANRLGQIEHIVLLMLENRSFDQMLGCLYDSGNAPPFDQVPRGQPFAGVSGRHLSNPIPPDAGDADRGSVPVGQATDPTTPSPDPGEGYAHVNTQLFGRVIPAGNRCPPFRTPYNLPGPRPDPAPMNGFVRDYSCAGDPAGYDQYRVIMDGFTPATVPVISTLANAYAVCVIFPRLHRYLFSHFAFMDGFYHDAAAGKLPSLCLIEPRRFLDHNDQHPPWSVLPGEQLIADVYRALCAGPGWERTLLIVTYDEHGGCYDHVPPPAAVPPHRDAPAGQFGFRFDRLGVRIPAVLVSPWIAGDVLSLDAPRADAPAVPSVTSAAPAPDLTAPPCELLRAAVALAGPRAGLPVQRYAAPAAASTSCATPALISAPPALAAAEAYNTGAPGRDRRA